MALANRIDTERARVTLARWLAERLPGAENVRVVRADVPSESGISAETLLFDAEWSDGGPRTASYAARVQPRTGSVWGDYDLGPEFELLRVLAATDIVVPAVHWLEGDESILGAPFIVMDRVDGRVPRDDPPFTASGWFIDLEPAGRRAVCDAGLDAMAAIQRIDASSLDVRRMSEMPMGGVDLGAQIERWRTFVRWASDGRTPTMLEEAFGWLERHRPPEPDPPAIVWGDARLGNMIFAGDGSVAAILDWELASLGNPEADLGWWLFIFRHHTEGIDLPRPEGVPSEAEMVARWEAQTGRAASNLHYFETWAATRFAAAMVRASRMMVDAGLLPSDTPMAEHNPGIGLLARLLGREAPAGRGQTFIGNR